MPPELRMPLVVAEKHITHQLLAGENLLFRPWDAQYFELTEKEVTEWVAATNQVFKSLFTTNEIADQFLAITGTIRGDALSETETHQRIFRDAMDHRLAFIRRLLNNLSIYATESEYREGALGTIHLICSHFHAVARQLRQRYQDRPTLEINDEYDVQDLFHALLRVHFDDIRPEDPSPSQAGASSRIDFVLRGEQIVVEVKKTRPKLRAKEVGEELIIDIERYRTHQDCRLLYCFVYDPDGHIQNPVGLENDLSRGDGRLTVKVEIFPKH